MKKLDIIINTYDTGEGFRIETVSDPESASIDAWIYHKDYGVKQMTFGVSKTEGEQVLLRLMDGLLDGYKDDYIADVIEDGAVPYGDC